MADRTFSVMSDGMDELGKAIADGRLGFGETLDMLMSAHIRMFGTPNSIAGINRLETRLSDRLVAVAEKAILAEGKQQEGFFHRVVDCVRDKIYLER